MILSLIVTNSCAQQKVKIYNKEVCGDLAEDGARCAHTLTDEKRDIPKAQWDIERVGMLCMNSEGFNDTETAIEELCLILKNCDYRDKEKLRVILMRVQGVAIQAQEARMSMVKP